MIRIPLVTENQKRIGENEFWCKNEDDILSRFNYFTKARTGMNWKWAKRYGADDIVSFYYNHQDIIDKIKVTPALLRQPKQDIIDTVTMTPYEVKGVELGSLINGMRYCEPFGKISTRLDLEKYYNIFDTANPNKWNRVTIKLYNHIKIDPYWQKCLRTMENSMRDIIIRNGIMPSNHLCLDFEMKHEWEGFLRIMVILRIRPEYLCLYFTHRR